MELLSGLFVILLMMVFYYVYQNSAVKPYQQQDAEDDFCVIDIRDYISAHRAPYPGAENIPLSYLPRALKERFDCPKNILVVSDDKRGAKLAARMIRRKQHKPIYYIQNK